MYQCTTIGPVKRHYFSRAERAGWLEAYAAQLENELAGVRERLQALQVDPTNAGGGQAHPPSTARPADAA